MTTLPHTQFDATVDATEFRHALGKYATGVTIVTASVGEKKIGMTANFKPNDLARISIFSR